MSWDFPIPYFDIPPALAELFDDPAMRYGFAHHEEQFLR
jgi:hypothetical protein